MPPDVPLVHHADEATAPILSPAWQRALMLVAGLALANVAAFFPDWRDMAHQWWESSTYNHVLLVPAIVAWLAWQRADVVLPLAPRPWWPPLIVAAGAVLLWVLGSFAGLASARQLGVVVLLIASIVTILGPKASAALTFPIGYLLFLVPFGDELVPALQMITAAITIYLVHLSGIVATIDGVFIDTPAGLFEVAEACSGVKFLIAMIAFGALVANICFISWRRRALFLIASVVVPILANGIRAWGTIYAAQYVGVEAAAGFDHIVYGWIFFAVVMALLLAGAWRFFDRPSDARMVDPAAIAGSTVLSRLAGMTVGPVVAAALLCGLVLSAKAWAAAGASLAAPMPPRIELPQVAGWTRVAYTPQVPWHPRASGADHRLLGSYRDASGQRVDVMLALYAEQREGGEASGFGEGALVPDSGWSWLADVPSIAGAKSERLLARGSIEREALTWYRTGDLLTGSNARLKLATMRDRLLLRAQPTVLLIISSESSSGRGEAGSADRPVERFVRSVGPVGSWIDRIVQTR